MELQHQKPGAYDSPFSCEYFTSLWYGRHVAYALNLSMSQREICEVCKLVGTVAGPVEEILKEAKEDFEGQSGA